VANEILIHNFPDANGTFFDSLSSDTGGYVLSAAAGSTSGAVTGSNRGQTINNRFRGGGGTFAQAGYVYNLSLPQNDIEVEFDMTFPATPGGSSHSGIAITGQASPDLANRNWACLTWFANEFIIQQNVSTGNGTEVASEAYTPTAGATKHLLLRREGNVWTAIVDSGTPYTWTDSGNTVGTSSRIMIFTGAPVGASSSTNVPQIDNLNVRTVAVTRSASVALSGKGNTTTSASKQRSVTVVNSGTTHTLVQSGRSKSVTVAISGKGNTTATGSRAPSVAVGISGRGNTTVSRLKGVSRAVVLSGGGFTTVSRLKGTSRAVVLSGNGVVDRFATPGRGGSVAISGRGNTVVTGGHITAKAVSLSGGGSTVVSRLKGINRTVVVSGNGTLDRLADRGKTGSGVCSGNGTLSVSKTAGRSRTVAISGAGATTVKSSKTYLRAVSLSGAGVLSVTVVAAKPSVASISGGGGLTVTTTKQAAPVSVAISGVGHTLAVAGKSVIVPKSPVRGDFAFSSTGNTTTPSVSKPSNLVDGDYVVIFLVTNGNDPTAVPSGFDLLGERTQSAVQMFVYGKYITNAAGEPGTYSFTSGTTATRVVAVRISGVDQSNPIDDVDLSGSNTSSNTLTGTTTVTRQTNDLLLSAVVQSLAVSSTSYTTSDFDEFVDFVGTRDFAAGSRTAGSVGSQGTLTWTSTDSKAWVMSVLALAPTPIKISGNGGGSASGTKFEAPLGTAAVTISGRGNTTVVGSKQAGIGTNRPVRSDFVAAEGTASTVTIAKPGNLVDGDLLVALIQNDGTAVTALPSGFQLVGQRAGGFVRLYAFVKYVTNAAGEPANYVWTLNNSANYGVVITRVSGVNPKTSIDQFSSNSGVSASPSSSSITTSQINDLLISFVGGSQAAGTSFTSAFWSVFADFVTNRALAGGSAPSGSIGAQGTLSWSSSSGSITWVSLALALRPLTAQVSGNGNPSLVGSTGSIDKSASVILSGNGVLVASSTKNEAKTVQISGNGALSASRAPGRTSSVGISGRGATTVSSGKARSVAVQLSGNGTPSLTGQSGTVLAVLVSGRGTPTAVSLKGISRAVTISGNGIVDRFATPGRSSTCQISGKGNTTVQGFASTVLAVVLSEQGHQFVTIGPKARVQTVSISGNGNLSTAQSRFVGSTVRLNELGHLTSTGRKSATTSLALSGRGTPAAVGRKGASGATAISGNGQPNLAGTPGSSAAIGLSGGPGHTTVSGREGHSSALSVSGRGAPTAVGFKGRVQTVVISGRGNTNVVSSNAASHTVRISGNGNLSAVGRKSATSAVVLSGGGEATFQPGSPVFLSGSGHTTIKSGKSASLVLRISGAGQLTSGRSKGGRSTGTVSGTGHCLSTGRKLSLQTLQLSGGGHTIVTPMEVASVFTVLTGNGAVTIRGTKADGSAVVLSGNGELHYSVEPPPPAELFIVGEMYGYQLFTAEMQAFTAVDASLEGYSLVDGDMEPTAC